MLGTSAWHTIYNLQQAGQLTADQAAEEYVNLARWQLQHKLGYRWTHPLRINDLRGRLLYHMILATNNNTGNKIMSDIYSKTVAHNPRLYDEAKQAISGQYRLMPVEPVASEQQRYQCPPLLPLLDEQGHRP